MENPYKHLKAHEGETFKYRELCDLLCLEFKRGKGKELQLKQLRQFLDLDQKTIPRKIVLKEIYDDTNQKIVDGKGKYLPFIKNILLNQLHNESPYIGTYKELISMLGLASIRYTEAKYKDHLPGETVKKKYAYTIDTDYLAEGNLYNFLSMTSTVLQEIIRSSLKQLEKKNLISVEHSLRLFRSATININGTPTEIIEHHDLSPTEHNSFVKIATDLIEEFHLSNRQQLFYRAPSKKTCVDVHELYRDRLNEFINNLGYKFSGPLFIISATQEGRDYEINPSYLNKSLLKNIIFKKFDQDEDLKKVIPQPTLDKLMAMYFGSPFSH